MKKIIIFLLIMTGAAHAESNLCQFILIKAVKAANDAAEANSEGKMGRWSSQLSLLSIFKQAYLYNNCSRWNWQEALRKWDITEEEAALNSRLFPK